MKTLKTIKAVIIGVNPLTVAFLSIVTFGAFAALYALLGGGEADDAEKSA